ncbi:hypothetical protein OC707_01880 ['Opuntia sp.' phytoplasma]|uniref:Uncharacterized protein n=1 Tax=Candidatus Phytoplasma asiaticum TaxID=2763338 RepID=A0AAX3B9U9_9MOLU|nr:MULTISPECIES: hypothetical protein [Phytoplasma]MDO8054194.1 hypothetical protein ['Opuntia sp.' phytoplasma]MDO8057822.1 hypothetical protein ['Opuntia sp.' phytoplasma]UQV27444.1 hypothetical protein H7686_0001325 ['Parthenium hysterophorus' phyllody phytoplasma]
MKKIKKIKHYLYLINFIYIIIIAIMLIIIYIFLNIKIQVTITKIENEFKSLNNKLNKIQDNQFIKNDNEKTQIQDLITYEDNNKIEIKYVINETNDNDKTKSLLLPLSDNENN